MSVTTDITLNRRVLLAVAAGFALRPVPSIAQAPTDYPNHAVRLVVPFGAGSGTDFVARLLASEQELPEVPTLAEAGLADFDVLTWVGVIAPAGIPAPVADRLADAMTRIMNQAELREKLESSGRPMSPTTRGAFVDYLRVQRRTWTTKVADASIQPE